MTDQKTLRRRIATLEQQQAKRIAATAQYKADMDRLVEEKQREIDNLKQQLTIGPVR